MAGITAIINPTATTTLFVVSPSYDYEGLGQPVGVFTTRELAEAYVRGQRALVHAHRDWRKAQPPIPRPAEDGGLFAQIERDNWAAWEAAEPPRAYHDGSWEIDETEVNP